MATKKTTKVETKVSQAEIDQMSELSDEKNTKAAPKFSLASLKINGKEGGYYKTVVNGDELETGEDGKAVLELVENPSGVILRPRKSFSFVGADYQLFTNEGGNTQKDVFTVFEKRETKKGFSIQAVFQGTPAQLKEKFPELKMTQVIYFLLDEPKELVRLKVKGMSLGNIFDYWKEFGSNEHLFQYKTILGEEKQKNKFGKFVVTTFKKGEKIADFTEIKKNMELIASKISEIEAYYKDRDAEMAEMAGADEPSRPERNMLDKEELKKATDELYQKGDEDVDDDEAEDEIDVAKIPFG